jgi:hypothetical protein
MFTAGSFRSLLVLLIGMFNMHEADAQWNNTYGNEWINYKQKYVKINVGKKGIHRVKLTSLPSAFVNVDPDKFQIWHRGKEIALIAANQNEVIFYGEPNDGSSDTLVYRPAEARLNPYISLFSDLGSYFLTVSDRAGKRIEILDGTDVSGVEEPYHLHKDIVKFNDQFSFSTFGIGNTLNNSFYEASNSWTGETVGGPNATGGSVKTNFLIKEYKFKNLVRSDIHPVLELLVNGLHEGQHDIQFSFGKSEQNDHFKRLGSAVFSGWGGKKLNYRLSNDDIDETGKGFLKVNSISTSVNDWFALSYYSMVYPQLIDMKDMGLAFFTLPAIKAKRSRVRVSNAPIDALVYDVTDKANPISVSSINGLDTHFMIGRSDNKSLDFLVVSSSQISTIEASRISEVDFTPIYFNNNFKGEPLHPNDYDYLIVTTSNLQEGAVKYAEYRSSIEGGGNRVLVIDISNIYNQFNYGEPSPIAIRRFCNYMLSRGIRDEKHNLLLIGVSSTIPVNLVKEMDGEVPTFGDPGSDILLVAGLNGYNENVPAIPVGRINALNSNEVIAYLSKVKIYEHQLDIGWRKNILHLNGGHSAHEIAQLKGLLSVLTPIVENGELGGKVQAFVKNQPVETTELVDISKEVNKGVGMITYFGHGSQNITDLDMGFVSDIKRGYQNTNNYSLMYFNGCGVGNIFTSRSRHILSGNWLMTPERGAVSIIANSYKSYVTTSANHLNLLYNVMFGEPNSLSIGQVVKQVAKRIVEGSPSSYDIANIHQSNVLGDPYLRVLRAERPDYAFDMNQSIFLQSESPNVSIGNSKSLKVGLVLYNHGRYVDSEIVPIRIKIYTANGNVETSNLSFKSVSYRDTLYVNIGGRHNINRIEVSIDAENTLNELSKKNNDANLIIDWEIAKGESIYTYEKVKDILPPLLTVKFKNTLLANGQVLPPNPEIVFTLEDNVLLSSDTSLVEIYLKSCEDFSCDYEKLSYSNSELVMRSMSSRKVQVSYFSDLMSNGLYELMVKVKDGSANFPVNPYTIRFEIKGDKDLRVVNSPNPTSNFVHFQLDQSIDVNDFRSIRWIVYDLNGAILLDKNSYPLTNAYSWYWTPNVSSGLYFYKVILNGIGGSVEELRGKISIVR